MQKRLMPLYFIEDELLKYPEEDRERIAPIIGMDDSCGWRWENTPRLKEMKKIDKRKSFIAHLKGQRSWKWTTDLLLLTMLDEGKRNKVNEISEYRIYLNWLSLRLKFCNEEVDNLVQDFLKYKLHYDYSIDGKETLFQTMKRYGITYCEAIYSQYVDKTGFRPTKTIGHWRPNIYFDRPYWHMNLNDTHTDIELYDPHLDDFECKESPEEFLERMNKKYGWDKP